MKGDDHSDLPLFAWRPSRAHVLVFPLDRRISKVRTVARFLNSHSQKANEAFWQRTIRSLSAELQKAGLPSSVIDSQIIGFREKVSAELTLMAYQSVPRPVS